MSVRCRRPGCKWTTNRKRREDDTYGECPWCAGPLTASVPLARKPTAQSPKPLILRPWLEPGDGRLSPPVDARYRDRDATWPELVAAEMERRCSGA